MKYLLPIFLVLNLFACNKKSEPGTNIVSTPVPLDSNCPNSFSGAFQHCIDKTGTLYSSSIADSLVDFKVIRAMGETKNILFQVNCDSNTIFIPTQYVVSFFRLSHLIYGRGKIYSDMIVVNYSLYQNVDGPRVWQDGYSDTLRR